MHGKGIWWSVYTANILIKFITIRCNYKLITELTQFFKIMQQLSILSNVLLLLLIIAPPPQFDKYLVNIDSYKFSHFVDTLGLSNIVSILLPAAKSCWETLLYVYILDHWNRVALSSFQ